MGGAVAGGGRPVEDVVLKYKKTPFLLCGPWEFSYLFSYFEKVVEEEICVSVSFAVHLGAQANKTIDSDEIGKTLFLANFVKTCIRLPATLLPRRILALQPC